jgi:methyltransferase (TIGR00027 family)
MKPDQPSATAIFVANGVWWVSNHSQLKTEVPGLLGELNLAMVRHVNRRVDTKLGSKILEMKTSLMQMVVMRGFYLHFVLRKRSIENYVRQAVQQNARQLIVIGAGFDTLSVRMAREFSALQIIEIDHPATQAWKRTALEDLTGGHSNVHLLPLDLTQQTMQQLLLNNEKYQAGTNTVVVAEGLTMYLSSKEVREILSFIKETSASGSRFIFTYMEERDPNDFQFKFASRLVDVWLAMKGEQFTWGLGDGQLEPFLNQSDFHLLDCATHKEFREELLSPANRQAALAVGENVAVAQWNQES